MSSTRSACSASPSEGDQGQIVKSGHREKVPGCGIQVIGATAGKGWTKSKPGGSLLFFYYYYFFFLPKSIPSSVSAYWPAHGCGLSPRMLTAQQGRAGGKLDGPNCLHVVGSPMCLVLLNASEGEGVHAPSSAPHRVSGALVLALKYKIWQVNKSFKCIHAK